MSEKSYTKLAELLRSARHAVFFGGAGASTESGIPDFRSAQGLYAGGKGVSPEELLSHTYFMRYPEDFFRFYREKMLYPDARPNAAHRVLAKWEQQGLIKDIITQNIDGLHQAAGSSRVWELHGSVHRNRCMHCGAAHSLQQLLDAPHIVPHCDCGGVIKPDVVLYEEPLDADVMHGAAAAADRCDLMIVGGTSLMVYPATGFAQSCRGKLVIINKSPTAMDGRADLVIAGSLGQALEATDRSL